MSVTGCSRSSAFCLAPLSAILGALGTSMLRLCGDDPSPNTATQAHTHDRGRGTITKHTKGNYSTQGGQRRCS